MSFAKIFTDLERQGVKQTQVLKLVKESGVDVSQANISKLARGVTLDPRYSLGKSIIDIHHKFCVTEAKSA